MDLGEMTEEEFSRSAKEIEEGIRKAVMGKDARCASLALSNVLGAVYLKMMVKPYNVGKLLWCIEDAYRKAYRQRLEEQPKV